MKKLWVISAVIMLAVWATVAFAAAQGGSNQPANQKQQAAANQTTMQGTISKINAQSKTMVLSVKQPQQQGQQAGQTKQQTVSYNQNTKIMSNGKTVQATQLKQGQMAKVTAKKQNNKWVATRVDIMPQQAAGGAQSGQRSGQTTAR